VVRKPRLHQAALVAAARGVMVLVAQVDLHPRDIVAEALQALPDFVGGPLLERFLVFEAVAGIHLDLHACSRG
jgi:hypothetical protein